MDRRTALAIGLTAAGALSLGTGAWMTGAVAASPGPQIGAPAPAHIMVPASTVVGALLVMVRSTPLPFGVIVGGSVLVGVRVGTGSV